MVQKSLFRFPGGGDKQPHVPLVDHVPPYVTVPGAAGGSPVMAAPNDLHRELAPVGNAQDISAQARGSPLREDDPRLDVLVVVGAPCVMGVPPQFPFKA